MSEGTKQTTTRHIRAINLDDETYSRLKHMAADTGLKMVDIHRIALRNLLASVEEHGTITVTPK